MKERGKQEWAMGGRADQEENRQARGKVIKGRKVVKGREGGRLGKKECHERKKGRKVIGKGRKEVYERKE